MRSDSGAWETGVEEFSAEAPGCCNWVVRSVVCLVDAVDEDVSYRFVEVGGVVGPAWELDEVPDQPSDGVAFWAESIVVGVDLCVAPGHVVHLLMERVDAVQVWARGWKWVGKSSAQECWQVVTDMRWDGQESVEVDRGCAPVDNGVTPFVEEGEVS